MKGDFSRDTFDPGKHYTGVLMQQGRVQLDADWNEQQSIHHHRIATQTRDVIGFSGRAVARCRIHDHGCRGQPVAGDRTGPLLRRRAAL